MLEGIVRESIGKTTAKKFRRDGYLTANLYAKGVENIQAAFKRGEFVRAVRKKDSLTFPVKVGDKELNVVIQEYQLHPVHGEVVHVDLRIAVPDQVTDYLVPVVTHGIPVGLKNKGVLVMSKKRVKVRGAIESMPAKFDLDVSHLDRDESILVRDIEVPEGCRMMDRPDVAVCGVIKAK
ncbi:MAG: 50S ribosomal protein L25/general stress protein Ctc [Sulfurovum sp.]|nr:50S ribosomal protein L25/general stress protein Ctc [Sulfurovum sp.]MCB4744422.1 50S ribosomal protein L25/general stress protein Ctc [Sulfurovum sp.]MCB4745882.1 50S ribosomal protein L25/general stress protein Ctc [Sulfurovum sp.]MCB4747576.1 50S ribosomal protein L25/general stress protein Ctc [Sulfurovum sp.]MCB4748949.1 50S ribosomal protein L25/general stress protein Ctc [Sulfurovum sp.]